MKLTPEMEEFSEHLHEKFYMLDWPEVISSVIEDALEHEEPERSEEYEFLRALRSDIEHRIKFGWWPDYWH